MGGSYENNSASHTPETVRRQDFRAFQQEIRTTSPGIVVAVNGFRCDVRPSWDRKFGEQDAPQALLKDVPIIGLSTGKSFLSMPVSTGDECMIFWSERESESFLTSGSAGPLKYARIHDYSDPFVLPCALSDPATLGFDAPDADTICLFGEVGQKLKIDVGGVDLIACMKDLTTAIETVWQGMGLPQFLIARAVKEKLGVLSGDTGP